MRSWLAAPYLLGLALLVGLPVGIAGWLATTEYYGFAAPDFTGWDNVSRLLADDLFWTSVGTAGLFALLVVPVRVALAVGLALLLHRRRRGAGAARTAVYLPSVVPDAAWALIWLWLLNPLYGPVAGALRAADVPVPGLLSEPWPTRLGIAAMLALQLGEAFVVAVAARNLVPAGLHDMAAVEGAGRWYAFRRVTLPLMAPVLVLLAARDVVLLVQATFVPVLLVTEGGPRYATLTSPLYVYRRAFLYGELGYASALSVALLVLTVPVLVLLLVGARRLRVP